MFGLTPAGTKLDYTINELMIFLKVIVKRGLIGMIIVKILMNALPEKRKEVLQTLLSMIEVIRQEKGCRSYHVFQDIQNENIFCLVEKWETREDLEHHMRSDRFSVLLGTKILLENEDQEIQVHTVLNTEGREIVNAVRGQRI
ncbi:MAG: putative quinol monooxygenase [Desulfobacterales bacterium]